MQTNPLRELSRLGQSVWIDFIQRGAFLSRDLGRLVDEDGVRGVTSNPTLFEHAVTSSQAYDEDICSAALAGKSASETRRRLTVADVQTASDVLLPVYERLAGDDGYVSLEVSPTLAYDTEGTVSEARALWEALGRRNVLIKVPATAAGIPAIRRLIGEGISVNVTLLFGLDRYAEVAEAYLGGLEDRIAQGKSIRDIASVASFFLSRIDVMVDPLLKKIQGNESEKKSLRSLAGSLMGQTAISSAKLAYQRYLEIFGGERFRNLRQREARPQRLLWASTGTKNPQDSDVKYVEAIIGPDTVTTLPLETLKHYRDHGHPANRLEEGVREAKLVLSGLTQLDISLPMVTERLEAEGVAKFQKSFEQLTAAIETKSRAAVSSLPIAAWHLNLGEQTGAVERRIERLNAQNVGARLWQKDPTLWRSEPSTVVDSEGTMGWLHVAEAMEGKIPELKQFAEEIREAGFRHVLHMGMGGSSLAPLVFQRTFSDRNGIPLTVLDTTDSSTIRHLTETLPLKHTLFIVASKSGTTAEPLAFFEYFYDRLKQAGVAEPGRQFVAITDPQTPLAALADERQFRKVFETPKDVGGRYSALSYFGLVPATLLGIDPGAILLRALRAIQASGPRVAAQHSPGLTLGAALGEMALRGRDKITVIADGPIASLGLWLEQLLAESTGKQGKGLIPVADEPLGSPAVYGPDRAFVYLTTRESVEGLIQEEVQALRSAGLPVITIELRDALDIGQEFFTWEFATAVAGSILGINPFDQPNVQESKDNTNRLLQTLNPDATVNVRAATEGALEALFSLAQPGDYIALLNYLPETPRTSDLLRAIRMNLRDALGLATTSGYGPRYLHSTGQLHKGGPNTGIFLQITAGDTDDIPVPGKSYGFGAFKRAQAQGDLEALRKHDRRVMRVHLAGEIEKGLEDLTGKINRALARLDRTAGQRIAI